MDSEEKKRGNPAVMVSKISEELNHIKWESFGIYKPLLVTVFLGNLLKVRTVA
jgi:hypothetical protein